MSTTSVSSKHLYQKLLNIKVGCIKIEDMSSSLTSICMANDVNIDTVFVKQLAPQWDNKLREFHFKVIFGILPCNKNLKTWCKREDPICDVCDSCQTIDHLLYYC